MILVHMLAPTFSQNYTYPGWLRLIDKLNLVLHYHHQHEYDPDKGPTLRHCKFVLTILISIIILYLDKSILLIKGLLAIKQPPKAEVFVIYCIVVMLHAMRLTDWCLVCQSPFSILRTKATFMATRDPMGLASLGHGGKWRGDGERFSSSKWRNGIFGKLSADSTSHSDYVLRPTFLAGHF